MTRTMLRRVLGGVATAGPLVFTIAWVAASVAGHGDAGWRSDITAYGAWTHPTPG